MAMNTERVMALITAYDTNPEQFTEEQTLYLVQLAQEAGIDWQPKTSMARLARNALFGAADTAAFGLLPNEWGGPAVTNAERIAGQVGSAAGMFFGGPAFLGRAAVKGAGRLATKYAAKIPNWMKVAEATTPAAEAAATTGADTAAGFLSNMTAKAGQVFKTAAANAGPLAMGAGRAGLQYGVMAGSSDVTNPEEAIARFFQGATTGAIGNTLGALTPEKMKLLAGTIYGLFGGGSTDSVENALIGMASFMGGKYTPMAAAGRAAEAVAETAAPVAAEAANVQSVFSNAANMASKAGFVGNPIVAGENAANAYTRILSGGQLQNMAKNYASAEAAGAAARTASRFKPSTSTGRAAAKASQSDRVYAAAERAYMTKGDEAPGYIFRKLKEMKYSDKQAIRIINKAQEALYKSGKLQQGRSMPTWGIPEQATQGGLGGYLPQGMTQQGRLSGFIGPRATSARASTDVFAQRDLLQSLGLSREEAIRALRSAERYPNILPGQINQGGGQLYDMARQVASGGNLEEMARIYELIGNASPGTIKKLMALNSLY